MSHSSTAALIVLAGQLLGPSVAVAQPPREVAARFLEAWNNRDWSQAARSLDLDQFDRFRRDFISRARQSSTQAPQMTVEQLRRREPDMPQEVAEYQIRRMEEQKRRFADPTPFEFAHVASLNALRALSPDEAAARWLESRDPRWQVKMQFEQAGCPAPDDLDQIPTAKRRLVGIVPEGDSVVYALFKEERLADDQSAWAGGDVSVMELKQARGGWVIQPKADLVPEVGQVDVTSCRGERR